MDNEIMVKGRDNASGIWRLDSFEYKDLLVNLNEIGRLTLDFGYAPGGFAFCEVKKVNHFEEEFSMRSGPFSGTSRLPISGKWGLFIPLSRKGYYIVGISSLLRREWISWYGDNFYSEPVDWSGSVEEFLRLILYGEGYPNQGWMDNHVSSLCIAFGGKNETVVDSKGSYRIVE